MPEPASSPPGRSRRVRRVPTAVRRTPRPRGRGRPPATRKRCSESEGSSSPRPQPLGGRSQIGGGYGSAASARAARRCASRPVATLSASPIAVTQPSPATIDAVAKTTASRIKNSRTRPVVRMRRLRAAASAIPTARRARSAAARPSCRRRSRPATSRTARPPPRPSAWGSSRADGPPPGPAGGVLVPRLDEHVAEDPGDLVELGRAGDERRRDLDDRRRGRRRGRSALAAQAGEGSREQDSHSSSVNVSRVSRSLTSSSA